MTYLFSGNVQYIWEFLPYIVWDTVVFWPLIRYLQLSTLLLTSLVPHIGGILVHEGFYVCPGAWRLCRASGGVYTGHDCVWRFWLVYGVCVTRPTPAVLSAWGPVGPIGMMPLLTRCPACLCGTTAVPLVRMWLHAVAEVWHASLVVNLHLSCKIVVNNWSTYRTYKFNLLVPLVAIIWSVWVLLLIPH